MATIRSFEELEVWKKARELASRVHEMSTSGPFARGFELRNQARKSSGSIMDNIAEGFVRGGRKEFLTFLGYSKGSAGELPSQFHRAYDSKYIDEGTLNTLLAQVVEISRMLSGLISYLNKSGIAGSRFHEPEIPYSRSGAEDLDSFDLTKLPSF